VSDPVEEIARLTLERFAQSLNRLKLDRTRFSMSQAINGHVCKTRLLTKPVDCSPRLLKEFIDSESYHLSRRCAALTLFITARCPRKDGR
jgi:hypothetical protein